MVLFDNSFLTLVLHPTLKRPPQDPSTGRTVERVQERVDLLLETLERDREAIIIPTPVLTEFLILIGEDGPRILSAIDSDRNYHVEGFDQRAAIELAVMSREIRAKGGGRRGDQEGIYAKIMFDRQIVAIAKVHNVTAIYSDDKGLGNFAEKNGLKVVRTWELPLPPEKEPLFQGALAEALAALDERGALESESADEERTSEGNGTETAATAATRVSAIPEPSTAVSLSPEEGSGTREDEAGKG